MKITQKLAIGSTRLKLNVLAFFSKKKAAEKAFELFCTPFSAPIKTIPTIFEKGEKLNFKLNVLTLQGFRWNHPQKHKVLILHGFASSSYKFGNYIEAFIHKGYEVLAFDAPAHGNSEGKTVNAVIYSSMIKKVIELFGPVNSFMAHSFGGMALSLALEEMPPDDRIKIAFIAPATETTTAIDTAFKMLGLKNSNLRDEVDKIIFNISGKETEWFSMKRIMYAIKAKILWIHDEEDETTPLSDALKVKADNHPNIEFIITKGLGHRRIYHDVDVKKQVIDFL